MDNFLQRRTQCTLHNVSQAASVSAVTARSCFVRTWREGRGLSQTNWDFALSLCKGQGNGAAVGPGAQSLGLCLSVSSRQDGLCPAFRGHRRSEQGYGSGSPGKSAATTSSMALLFPATFPPQVWGSGQFYCFNNLWKAIPSSEAEISGLNRTWSSREAEWGKRLAFGGLAWATCKCCPISLTRAGHQDT